MGAVREARTYLAPERPVEGAIICLSRPDHPGCACANLAHRDPRCLHDGLTFVASNR